MIEKHKEFAEHIFTSMEFSLCENGIVPPLYFLILEGDQLLPILISRDSGEVAVQDYANLSLMKANEMDAEAVIFICEQYMVSKKKGDREYEQLLNGFIKPSQYPDREEYMTLIYRHEDGLVRSLISKIYTDPKGTRYTKDRRWIKKGVTNLITPWN